MNIWPDMSPYQLLILAVGGGLGSGVCLFGLKAFVNAVIKPKLYDEKGQPIYVSKADCAKQTEDYRIAIREEFKDVKEWQKNQKELQDKILSFQSALQGYYIAKGVKFP